MNFITKKHLSRRTFLRGAGVAVALPLLDSMLPAQTPLRATAANVKTRFGAVYVPHGATMYKWTPAKEGRNFDFSETLSPLEKYRNSMNVISNLCHQSSAGADAADEHFRSAALYLSGPLANNVTGQILMVDAGYSILGMSLADHPTSG